MRPALRAILRAGRGRSCRLVSRRVLPHAAPCLPRLLPVVWDGPAHGPFLVPPHGGVSVSAVADCCKTPPTAGARIVRVERGWYTNAPAGMSHR